jgi:EpsI family protein
LASFGFLDMLPGSASSLFRRESVILTAVLLLQVAVTFGFSRREHLPSPPPLASFPDEVNGWHKVQDNAVEREMQDVLQADDLLNRIYVAPDRKSSLSLFVAYFQSQRTGKAPHSPKNCLPGSGWMPIFSERTTIPISNGNPIPVNRYIVQRGDQYSLVMYWYQSHKRVIASEYAAKLYLVWDSMRLNRSDTALVRIVANASNSREQAEASAARFAQDVFPHLQRYLP